jgi:citrate lyase subunit beta/citryl-CoA lyase
MLFVPATAPNRFPKAQSSGADLVVIDLEDSVAAAHKMTARVAVEQWLRAGHRAVVRVNSAATDWYGDDLELVARHRCPVMLPKADVPTVREARDALHEGAELLALIETAQGVAECLELCRLGVATRLAFGALDLTTELGVDPAAAHGVLQYARAALVVASAAAGLPPPVDSVTADVRDTRALQADLELSRSAGFTGKLAIHPAQVAAINEAYTPSAAELAWAREICTAAGAGDGVTTVRGVMVDLPVLTRARRVLERSRALSEEDDAP